MSQPDIPSYAYTDYGPKPKPEQARTPLKWINRPFCDMCGPFRGRYLRSIGFDEFGREYRCRARRIQPHDSRTEAERCLICRSNSKNS